MATSTDVALLRRVRIRLFETSPLGVVECDEGYDDEHDDERLTTRDKGELHAVQSPIPPSSITIPPSPSSSVPWPASDYSIAVQTYAKAVQRFTRRSYERQVRFLQTPSTWTTSPPTPPTPLGRLRPRVGRATSMCVDSFPASCFLISLSSERHPAPDDRDFKDRCIQPEVVDSAQRTGDGCDRMNYGAFGLRCDTVLFAGTRGGLAPLGSPSTLTTIPPTASVFDPTSALRSPLSSFHIGGTTTMALSLLGSYLASHTTDHTASRILPTPSPHTWHDGSTGSPLRVPLAAYVWPCMMMYAITYSRPLPVRCVSDGSPFDSRFLRESSHLLCMSARTYL